jgi:hypothetical protein
MVLRQKHYSKCAGKYFGCLFSLQKVTKKIRREQHGEKIKDFQV